MPPLALVGVAGVEAEVIDAAGRNITGEYRRHLPNGGCYQWFKYQVIRLGEQPAETLLKSGLGTLPLAPLADVERKELPSVIQRMRERIEREAPPEDRAHLWTATFVLMGLRYSLDMTKQLLRGVREMRESTTYQAILEEGRMEGIPIGEARGSVKEAQTILLRQGTKRFGPPTARTRRKIESITSVEWLEWLAERLLDVTSWKELLAGLSTSPSPD